MYNPNAVMRFRHHFLAGGSILTVCTSLNHNTRVVKVGWALFNSNDNRWIRRVGNQIAKDRLNNTPLSFVLTSDEPIICDYISLRALMVIFAAAKRVKNSYQEATPQVIPRETLADIQCEMIEILNLFGQRVGLHSIFED